MAPDATCSEIVERLGACRVGAVPVVDTDRRVVGIVSEADLLLLASGDAARAKGRNAAAVMTTDVATVGPDATLTDAARLMHRRGVKRLPVVDCDGRLIGIVSRTDLLRPFLRSDESIAYDVREEVLRRTLAVDPNELTISVDGGVVRLEGELETRSPWPIVDRMLASIAGVVGVDDRLTWGVEDRPLPPTPPPALCCSADERG